LNGPIDPLTLASPLLSSTIFLALSILDCTSFSTSRLRAAYNISSIISLSKSLSFSLTPLSTAAFFSSINYLTYSFFLFKYFVSGLSPPRLPSLMFLSWSLTCFRPSESYDSDNCEIDLFLGVLLVLPSLSIISFFSFSVFARKAPISAHVSCTFALLALISFYSF